MVHLPGWQSWGSWKGMIGPSQAARRMVGAALSPKAHESGQGGAAGNDDAALAPPAYKRESVQHSSSIFGTDDDKLGPNDSQSSPSIHSPLRGGSGISTNWYSPGSVSWKSTSFQSCGSKDCCCWATTAATASAGGASCAIAGENCLRHVGVRSVVSLRIHVSDGARWIGQRGSCADGWVGLTAEGMGARPRAQAPSF